MGRSTENTTGPVFAVIDTCESTVAETIADLVVKMRALPATNSDGAKKCDVMWITNHNATVVFDGGPKTTSFWLYMRTCDAEGPSSARPNASSDLLK